jgi:glycogen(starch) synthase
MQAGAICYNPEIMHVLQLSWEYPPHIIGGLGRHVAEISPALAEEGTTVTVITPWLRGGAYEECPHPRLRVLRVRPPDMPDHNFAEFVNRTNESLKQAAMAQQLVGEPFDLIHAHDWLVASATVALKHEWRIPLIATIHATERGRGGGYLQSAEAHRINDLEWKLTYEAWRVIVCSQFMVQQIHEHFNTPRDKIDMVPNGVIPLLDPFTDDMERTHFRRRFAADDEHLLFSVGRIVYEKGLQVLLDAWPQITTRHKARLVIAGIGGYLESLKAQAQALDITDRVQFLGFISNEDRNRLYHVADIAVFPSLYEPFGIVALEAFASGCPLIASDAGGLAEVVEPERNGVVVRAGDAGALASGIFFCLERPEWARARAIAALDDIHTRYSWHRIAVQTINVYRRVTDAWKRGSWGHEPQTLSQTPSKQSGIPL